MAVVVLIYCILTVIGNAQKNYLWQPEKVYASERENIELYVVIHEADVRGAENQQIATVKLRTFQWGEESHFIGPTIVAKPGETVNITLINNLTGVGRANQIKKLIGPDNAWLKDDKYKDPDVTNLHTHGLHVNPLVDDVLKWASPNCPKDKGIDDQFDYLDCYDPDYSPTTAAVTNRINYPYELPSTHYPGTHWYHAHWHGSVTFDVIQGLYGLFLVEELDENDKFVPDEQQIQLLIGYAWLHDKTDCFSNNPKPTTKYTRPAQPSPTYPFAFPIQSTCLIYKTMDGEAGHFRFNSTGKNYTQSDLSDIGEYPVNTTVATGPNGVELFLVNGQIKPVIPMTSNKWYHLRMVNTVMNYLLFWVRDDDVTANCNIYVMGRDGVYFNETRPRNIQNPPYRNRTIVIPPGSRADVAVQCNCTSYDGVCEYDIYASSSLDDDEFIPVPLEDHLLFKMEVSNVGNETADQSKFEDWRPQPYAKTPYLVDTTDESVEYESFCAKGDYTVTQMSQCNIVHGRKIYPALGGGGSPVSMNQILFVHNQSMARICTGRTREWTVTTNWHPFHHHTWPFQLQRDVSLGWIGMKGDWRDTLGAPGMMVQVALEPEESEICNVDNRSYIIPNPNISNREPETVIAADCTDINTFDKSASSVIQLLDVNTFINVTLTLTDDCKTEFSFAVTPRTETIGNLWIGVGFEAISDNTRFDLSNPNANYPIMDGNALIISLLADATNSPLAKVTQLEVELNPINRTSFIIDEGNYFDCNVEGLTDIGGVKRFTCSRPTCSDESKPFCNLDEDRNFIIAYGEGQFRGNETYHSSRGGCAYTFKRDKPIQCIISQKEVTYSLPLPKPNTPGPTAFYTSFDTTFDNESFGVKVSYNIYTYCVLLLSFCIALF